MANLTPPQRRRDRTRARVGHRDVRRIGDALAPRTIEAVIYEGEKCGREI